MTDYEPFARLLIEVVRCCDGESVRFRNERDAARELAQTSAMRTEELDREVDLLRKQLKHERNEMPKRYARLLHAQAKLGARGAQLKPRTTRKKRA